MQSQMLAREFSTHKQVIAAHPVPGLLPRAPRHAAWGWGDPAQPPHGARKATHKPNPQAVSSSCGSIKSVSDCKWSRD